MSMKACNECGEEKPLTEFHRNAKSKDGHLNSCKPCRKIYSDKYRKSESAKENRKRYLSSPEGRAVVDKHNKLWKERNKLKCRAHNLVNAHIRRGKIAKGESCEVCGDSDRLHAHHDDYSKPTEIRWLCPQCHADWHNKHGKGIFSSLIDY